MINKNNISIDVEINSNGHRQLNQYSKAFDSLRTAITNLSAPLNTLDKNLSSLSNSIDKLSEGNVSLSGTITNVGNAFGSFKAVTEGVGEVLKLLKLQAVATNAALTGGISLVLTFLPEIINLVSAFFKGKEALGGMVQNLKNLNEVMKTANADTATQRTKLDLLYKSATDVNNAQEDRLKSVAQLKSEFPNYFKQLNDEDILNGKAKKKYDELSRSIFENAKAKAALSKMTEQAAKLLDAEYQIEKIKTAHNNEVRRKKKEIDQTNPRFRWVNGDKELAEYTKEADERRDKAIKEQQNIQKSLQAQYKFFEKRGGGVNAIAKAISTDNTEMTGSDVAVRINYSNNDIKTSKKAPKEKLRTPGEELEDPRSNGIQSVKDQLDQSVLQGLNAQKEIQITHTKLTQEEILKIETEYAQKKAKLEDELATKKIHAGDKFIDAALKNSKKDSAIFKAAFLAKKATSIADTVISTKRAVMESLKAYAGIPFIGQALGIAQAVFMGAQGASSIAEIAKQKPGFAKGGRYSSDGKGALLPGYSNFDDTNAYLRSGEAVVVSEAMRNPWARNLVSAINVAYGGRDFSIANPGTGYAIGGIFTDGGNTNRYYNQPVNDQQALANSIAYQMVNNFPPIYVDVKDINTQQSVLARTVDRVNL